MDLTRRQLLFPRKKIVVGRDSVEPTKQFHGSAPPTSLRAGSSVGLPGLKFAFRLQSQLPASGVNLVALLAPQGGRNSFRA